MTNLKKLQLEHNLSQLKLADIPNNSETERLQMSENFPAKAQEIMIERFGRDTLISLATVKDETPWVRTVNSYYENGAFYVITHAHSNKIKQIQNNSKVAICGDWFTAHGIGENLGHILDKKNQEIAGKLRTAFAEWYNNGHTNEKDPNTCILCIHLTSGVLFSHGTKYNIDFTEP